MIKSRGNAFKILYILIPLGIAGLAAGVIWMKYYRDAGMMTMPPQQVILETVAKRDYTYSTEYVAQLEADESVELKARVSGFLVAKNFQDGDVVKKGQVLFQIEPDQYQSLLDAAEGDVISAQAELDRASLDFDRIRDLYNKRTSPKSDFDRSKATFDIARAALISAQARRDQATLNLKYAAITAPFDGQVSDTPYSLGALLGPESGVLAQVVTLNPILVTFGISDRLLVGERSKAGGLARQKETWVARLRLTSDYYYPEVGRFTYISPTVDRQTDTVKMKAQFSNPNQVLRPGQTVTVVVEKAQPEQLILIPQEAVMTDVQGRFVFVPKENGQGGWIADRRAVTISAEIGLDYVISDGLREGEQIVIKGLMSAGSMLRPGSPIQIAAPEASAPAETPQQARDSDQGGN